MTDPAEWVELFFRKSGDRALSEDLIYLPFGFVQMDVRDNGKLLFVGQACGEGPKLSKFLDDVAKRLGCTRIQFMTYRNPKAWERSFGFKQVGYVLEREVKQ